DPTPPSLPTRRSSDRERRPRLGSIVASPSLIELQQVFHLRVQLEGQAARLAALNATEAEMAEIKEAYEGAEQVIAARDWRALIRSEEHTCELQLRENV